MVRIYKIHKIRCEMDLLALIWFSIHTVVKAINCPENVFQMVTTLNNTLITNAIGMHTGLTVHRCGEICLETPTCASFSYLLKDGYECHLFGHRAWYGWGDHTVYNELVTYWLLAETCPSDYTYDVINNVCYKAYFDAADVRNFGDAMARCQQDGGYLFVGNTVAKFQILQGLDALPFVNAFIGGTGQGTKWTWFDGSVFNTNVWHSGEPSMLTEECAAMVYVFLPKAIDVICDIANRFICEIPIRT